MIHSLKEWITGITYVSLIAGIMIAVTPKGKPKQIAKFAGGLLLMIAFLKPMLSAGHDTASFFTVISNEKEEYRKQFERDRETALNSIIEQKTAAYILDKARELGIADCRISLRLQANDNQYAYPYEVWVTATVSNEQHIALAEIIEKEIGIASSMQHWSENGI